MKSKKLRVGFAGARWLGIECLKYLSKRSELEIVAVCVPRKREKVWWKDVVDEDEVKKLGLSVMDWKDWTNLKLDIVFSVLHGEIFKQIHLENYKFGAINLHPAPLPEYRGCNSYAHAIMNGDKQYRVTLHYIETGVDTGPIIDSGKLSINPIDTGRSLYDKAQPVALSLFKKNLGKILLNARNGKLTPARKQDSRNARYYPRNSIYNKEASFNWRKDKLYNFIRALDFPPFEPAFAIIDGHKVYLTLRNFK